MNRRILVMVSGPREVALDFFLVKGLLNNLFSGEEYHPTLRQGGAKGVDTIARLAATELGWDIEPDWKPQYNKVPANFDPQVWKRIAPLKRTEAMLDGVDGPFGFNPVKPAVLIVFRRGPELEKGGTSHAVREARKRRIPITVFEFPEEG